MAVHLLDGWNKCLDESRYVYDVYDVYDVHDVHDVYDVYDVCVPAYILKSLGAIVLR